jgi:hypothetical protein
LRQRVPPGWIRKAGTASFRLQDHASWHSALPPMHRPAENTEIDSRQLQVCGSSDSVRTCADDGNLGIGDVIQQIFL